MPPRAHFIRAVLSWSLIFSLLFSHSFFLSLSLCALTARFAIVRGSHVHERWRSDASAAIKLGLPAAAPTRTLLKLGQCRGGVRWWSPWCPQMLLLLVERTFQLHNWMEEKPVAISRQTQTDYTQKHFTTAEPYQYSLGRHEADMTAPAATIFVVFVCIVLWLPWAECVIIVNGTFDGLICCGIRHSI